MERNAFMNLQQTISAIDQEKAKLRMDVDSKRARKTQIEEQLKHLINQRFEMQERLRTKNQVISQYVSMLDKAQQSVKNISTNCQELTHFLNMQMGRVQ